LSSLSGGGGPTSDEIESDKESDLNESGDEGQEDNTTAAGGRVSVLSGSRAASQMTGA